MNKNISEEELLLRKRARRRLVGAVVLVIFSVIVLPLIFDEPKPENEQHEIAIHLPSSGIGMGLNAVPIPREEIMEPKTLDEVDLSFGVQDKYELPQQSADEIAKISNERRHIPIPGIKPRIDRRVVETRETNTANITERAKPVESAKPVDAIASTDTTSGFVVQLGAYSDPLKAKQQQDNLIFHGFKAYTETLRINNNQVTRVRIGPFANRDAAENELKALKRHGLDGVVAPK